MRCRKAGNAESTSVGGDSTTGGPSNPESDDVADTADASAKDDSVTPEPALTATASVGSLFADAGAEPAIPSDPVGKVVDDSVTPEPTLTATASVGSLVDVADTLPMSMAVEPVDESWPPRPWISKTSLLRWTTTRKPAVKAFFLSCCQLVAVHAYLQMMQCSVLQIEHPQCWRCCLLLNVCCLLPRHWTD